MIILDFHSKIPIYEQIEEQVMLMVRRGVYKPHDRQIGRASCRERV